MRANFHAVAALALLAAAPSALAQTFLTIGEGWALVREVRTIPLRQGVQRLVLDNLPPGIDLSTLMVRTRRMETDLQSWGLRGESAASVPAVDKVLAWTPGPRSDRAASVRSGPVSVQAEFVAPADRDAVDIEIVYRTSGISWSASYQVVVRGDRVEEREPLSADLTGWVRLWNRTGLDFSNAMVRLVGRRAPPPEETVKPPGFLILDEYNPMSDLWRWHPPEPDIEYEYALPRAVHLASGSDPEFVLVKSERIPAARRYVLRAEEFTASLAAPERPLRKYILVANTAANRLGMNLPPGPVQLFLGSMRSQLLQTGDLPHTPVNGELRMDLGPSGEVLGRRGLKSRVPQPGGDFTDTFVVEVMNRRDGAIAVELDEKPPLIFDWTLIRSTQPCREVFRRLYYELDVPAAGRKVVEYSLRVRQPSL
jgi:hypothetical protein